MTATDSPIALPDPQHWSALMDLALAEDIGPGDVTSRAVIDRGRVGRARVEARAPLVVCGLPLVEEVFRRVDDSLVLERTPEGREGRSARGGDVLLRIRGAYDSILTAERTALNFLGRLCGIATQTRRLVDQVSPWPAALVDTRKTTPGWRMLEKYAVAAGGGTNHRIGLFDALLVKDNHIAAAGGLDAAVERALSRAPADLPVQVEVESEAMADRAIAMGCRFLLLDNLDPETIRRIVEKHGDEVLLEASGGIGPDNVAAYAATGIARISMGALTHSAPCADVALEVDLLPESDA